MKCTGNSVLACCATLLVLSVTTACSNPEATKQKHLARGSAAIEAKQYDEAILAYRNVLKSDVQNVTAHQRLAEAYQKKGDTLNAARESIRVADLRPEDPAAQLTAARYLLFGRQFEDAANRARRAIEIDKRNVEAHIVLGSAIAGLKDLDGAVKQLQEAIDIDPASGAGHANMGALLLSQGRKPEALASFEKAVALRPDSLEARLALATYHLNVGSLPDAETAVKAALAIDPASGSANRAMAMLLIGSGRAAEAEPYMQAVVKAIGSDDAELSLADYYVRINRADSARTILERIARDSKVAHLASTRLAVIDYMAGQREAAHRRLDTVLERLPANPEALVVKGQWLLAENRGADALRMAEAAVKADPRSVSGLYVLGRARIATGNRKGAEEAFNEVLQINPRAGAAQTELARLNFAAGRVETGVQMAQEAVKNQPANLDARLLLIHGLIARGDLPRAQSELAPLTKALSTHPAIRGISGTLLAAKGDASGARREYEAALAIEPGQMEALTGITALDIQAGQVDRARQRLNAQLARAPASTSLLLLAARADLQARDVASGEGRLRQIIAQDPSTLVAYELLARLYIQQKRLDEARKEFEAIAAREPRAVGAHTFVGIIHNTQNRNEEAEKAYERALEVDPTAPVAANNLAFLHAERGHNLEQALALAKGAAERLKDVPEAQDTVGWIYFKKGQPALAIPEFEACVRKAPTNPLFHFHLGLAYSRTGDIAKARRALGEALRLSPSFAGADEARRTLASLGA